MARTRLLLILSMLIASVCLHAQCELPASAFRHEDNMFSSEREMDLGEAMGERIEKSLSPIADPELNAYVNLLGQRILHQLPDSNIRYRFLLIDEPYANAFGIAGGRIYVTRKVALTLKNEDELAGLLAHEIGHIYTHQIAIDYTSRFRELGINTVNSRAEVFKDYHQFLDTWRLKKYKWRPRKEYEGQSSADLVAIYAMSRAGYNPQTFSEFFDRFVENHGRTGSFFSDLFGTTTEESRRFRAMLNATAKLPPACIEQGPSRGDQFSSWQQKLLEWRGSDRTETLHDVVLRRRLDPPLQSDVSRLRFSPDGEYLLAQDDASINILTRTPFAFLFRLDPPEGATGAMFTPDSKNVVIPTRTGRVEVWNILERKRISVHEIAQLHPCIQQSVSNDGKYLACYRSDFGLDLIDVETGNKILEKKSFSSPDYYTYLSAFIGAIQGVTQPDFIHMGFSSDGRYFAAAGHDAAYAVELSNRTQVHIDGDLSSDMRWWFAFGNQGRILTYNMMTRGGALVREFPSGKTISKIHVGEAIPSAVTKGDFLQVRPVQGYAIGLLDPAVDKIFMGTNSSALDVYDKAFVNENRGGTIVKADITPTGPVNSKSLILPRAELANLRSLAISDDLGWLALSENSRGAIFDLHQGSREVHVRSFHGAWFNSDGTFLGDFPKYEKTDRQIVSVDLKTKSFNPLRKVEEKSKIAQQGPYLIVWRSEEKHSDRVTAEVHDVRDDKLLWSRDLEGGTFFSDWVAGTGVLLWQATASPVEKAAAANASLRQKINALADKKQSFYIEVVDLKTGKQLGSLVIDTGKASYRVRQIQATPTMVVVADTDDRIRVYSLKDGSEYGVIFANRYDISNAGLLVIGAGNNRLQIYDAESLEQIDQFSFADPIAFVRFLATGNRLLVITRDQTIFVLEPKRETAPMQASK